MKSGAFAVMLFASIGLAPAYASSVVTTEPSEHRRSAGIQSEKRCPPEIGSRIVRRGAACNDARRRYSQEDLRATGEVDLSRALEKLDPAISRCR